MARDTAGSWPAAGVVTPQSCIADGCISMLIERTAAGRGACWRRHRAL
jgi:hypothetical protein